VGIIMDGNGRWASSHGALRTFGHRRGTQNVKTAIEFARESQIAELTLFAFSTENWKRPAQEVNAIMGLFVEFLASETPELAKQGARLSFIGEIAGLPDDCQEAAAQAMEATASGRSIHVNVAVNYGSRAELVRACRLLAEEAARGDVRPEDIGEADISARLYNPECPELDLLIRTGAEARISNFMLWQAAYAEIYFTPVLWPDFGREAFGRALEFYAGRERRFGGLT